MDAVGDGQNYADRHQAAAVVFVCRDCGQIKQMPHATDMMIMCSASDSDTLDGFWTGQPAVSVGVEELGLAVVTSPGYVQQTWRRVQ